MGKKIHLSYSDADEISQSGGVLIMRNRSMGITNTSKTEDLHIYPSNIYLININGRLCQVTVPADVSIQEAIKSIQEAEDAEREPFDKSLLTGLAYHSGRKASVAIEDIMDVIGVQPAPKPKQNHNWYKFNQRNKYGR